MRDQITLNVTYATNNQQSTEGLHESPAVGWLTDYTHSSQQRLVEVTCQVREIGVVRPCSRSYICTLSHPLQFMIKIGSCNFDTKVNTRSFRSWKSSRDQNEIHDFYIKVYEQNWAQPFHDEMDSLNFNMKVSEMRWISTNSYYNQFMWFLLTPLQSVPISPFCYQNLNIRTIPLISRRVNTLVLRTVLKYLTLDLAKEMNPCHLFHQI